MADKIRVAVVGAGVFGRHHLRILSLSQNAQLAGVLDVDPGRASAAATEYKCPAFATLDELAGQADAAMVAVPTSTHSQVGCALLEHGLDVLVEKPIAADRASAERLVETAARRERILQVGHLEHYNPAVVALKKVVHLPLFFEIHRLSLPGPRSLDVDVVLDLMIHDLDIVLDLVGAMPEEIQAAGISVLSDKADIANVRLAFPGGCIANLTASRVSTERVRKLRLFQPHQYISLDYQKQEAAAFTVSEQKQIGFQMLPVTKDEPLRLEVESFLEAVRNRTRPLVSGAEGLRALDVALAILAKIEAHTELVTQRIQSLREQPSA
ncbi:MAG TPA: Gfo/Idh/MocA family oxidoreductase [Bryobacteraceae bacterium]|nr:Gfo/Idh/MocA family oxidoreductase [Bryobacteraceae bacterium]